MAYDFVRASSQSITSTTSPIASAGTITIALFVNSVNTNVTERIFYAQKADGKEGAGVYNLNFGSASRGIYYIDPNYPQPVATGSFTAATWHHYCTKQASTTSRDMFRDGGNKGSNTTTQAAQAIERLTLGVGLETTGLPGLFFSGRLAEAAIWSVALDDAEIASLAKGFTPTRIRPQSLVFYAPLIRQIADYRSATALTANNTPTVYEHPRRFG